MEVVICSFIMSTMLELEMCAVASTHTITLAGAAMAAHSLITE